MTLAKSKNLVFNYSTFNDVHGDFYHNATAPGEYGIAQIYRESCPDAVYDSQGRYPPPMCLPSTRKAVLKEVLEWTCAERENILWLHGPAGVGKSAIAQTVAEICAKKGILAASFFFSRDSPGRDTAGRLIPSIVYQLTVSLPEKRSLVGSLVEEDPSILHKSTKVQAETLIVSLFSQSSEIKSTAIEQGNLEPFLIIIDGLDECKGDNNQREIVRILGELVLNTCVPFHFFIASRPEPQIKNAFRLLTGSMRHVSLSDFHHMVQGKKDVHLFLEEGFKEIVAKHHEAMARVRRPWPEVYVVAQLASKAGGMFIYASTVLRYIDDDDFHPPDRLEEVINTPTGRTPFAELDRLYKHILSECNDIKLLLRVLSVLLLQKTWGKGFLGEFEIEILLHLSSGTIRRVLRRMHSILDITESGRIHFYHASFGDFVLNKMRAEEFYIDKAEGHAFIAEALIDNLGTWSGSTNVLGDPQFTVQGYALELWSYHCQEAHWSKYPRLLTSLFKKFDLQWWNEYPILRNETLHGIRAGNYWLKNLDDFSQQFEYSSITIRKRIIEKFWSRAFGNAVPTLQARYIVLYETLDDLTVDGLLAFEHISWGRRTDWMNRRIQYLPGPRGKQLLLISEVVSPSRFIENVKAFVGDNLMGYSLDDVKEVIQDYLKNVSISMDYTAHIMHGHINMGLWCISMISKGNWEIRETPAFRYAWKYWAQHISNAPPGNKELLNSLQNFDPRTFLKGTRSSNISIVIKWLEMMPTASHILIQQWKGYYENKMNKLNLMVRKLMRAR